MFLLGIYTHICGVRVRVRVCMCVCGCVGVYIYISEYLKSNKFCGFLKTELN